MRDEFEIRVGSDQDYEDLIADIYYQGEFVCLVSQESGFDYLDIEIHPRADEQAWKFKLAEFELALSDARNRLWELRRTESLPQGGGGNIEGAID